MLLIKYVVRGGGGGERESPEWPVARHAPKLHRTSTDFSLQPLYDFIYFNRKESKRSNAANRVHSHPILVRFFAFVCRNHVEGLRCIVRPSLSLARWYLPLSMYSIAPRSQFIFQNCNWSKCAQKAHMVTIGTFTNSEPISESRSSWMARVAARHV